MRSYRRFITIVALLAYTLPATLGYGLHAGIDCICQGGHGHASRHDEQACSHEHRHAGHHHGEHSHADDDAGPGWRGSDETAFGDQPGACSICAFLAQAQLAAAPPAAAEPTVLRPGGVRATPPLLVEASLRPYSPRAPPLLTIG